MSNYKLPQLSSDLIKLLDEMFPERCFDWRTPMDEVRFKSGQRFVVNYLLSLQQDVENELLRTVINKP